MDQRKVVSLGRSSLVISLPKQWIKMNDLKRGDVVSSTIQRDRSLVIFPGVRKKKEGQKIVLRIDPNEEEGSIVRKIIACYLNGYFDIELVSTKAFTAEQQKVIRDTVGKLYIRIMYSSAKNMHVQTLIDESSASVEAGIHRMHTIANSMCHDVLNSLRNRDVALAKVVYSLDEDVDHFSFLLLRLLRSTALDPVLANQLGLEPIDCLDYQTLVHRIEHIADHAAKIAKHIMILDRELTQPRPEWMITKKQQYIIPDSVLELMWKAGNEILNTYGKAVKAFFSGDVEGANKVIKSLESVEKLNEEITYQFFKVSRKYPALNYPVCCSTCSIRDSMSMMAEYVADIANLTINRSYRLTASR